MIEIATRSKEQRADGYMYFACPLLASMTIRRLGRKSFSAPLTNKLNHQPNRRLNHQQIVSPSTDLSLLLIHVLWLGDIPRSPYIDWPWAWNAFQTPINGDVTRSKRLELFKRQ